MLLERGFHLTKWVNNRKEVLNAIPENEMSKELKNINLEADALPSERALGLHWDVESDMFTFQISMKNKPLTHRGILSIVSSVYDPLGFISPFVLTAKIILDKIDWNEEISGDNF